MKSIVEVVGCMGGFCHQRDKCRVHVNSPDRVEDIHERICKPGQERPVPIEFIEAPHGDKAK